MTPELSHVHSGGGVRMVDTSAKEASARVATARARVRFSDAGTLAHLRGGATAKGDVLNTARIAGIMAAKRTWELIPLCHQVPLDSVEVDVEPADDPAGVVVTATARCRGVTGVEMEALTAASVAALTVVDMLKAVDRWMTIDWLGLLEKHGGRHGDLVRPADLR